MTDKHERRPAGYLVEGTFLVELPADAPPEAMAFERDGKRFGWKSGRAVQFETEDGRAVTAPYDLDGPSGAAIAVPYTLDPAAMPAVATDPLPAALDPTAALAVAPDLIDRGRAAEQRIDPAAVLVLDPLAGMSAADMPVNLSAAVAAGRQLALDIRHIRERLDPEQVAGLATTIEAEFGPMFVDMFADDLPNAIEFEVVVTPDDADTPEAIAAEQANARAIAAEVQHILRTNRYEIVRNAADADYWRAFAADVLAHAWAWAVEDARGDHIEQLDTMTDAEFEAAVERIYADSAGIEQAIAVLSEGWGHELANRLTAMLTKSGDNGSRDSIADWLIDHARANLQQRTELEQVPAQRPAFDPNGHGRTPSDIISHGARLAMVATWPGVKSKYPEFPVSLAIGIAIYTPSPQMYATPAEAWKLADALSDEHADVFDWILAKWLANRGNLGPFSGVYLTPADFLTDRGIQKHGSGGYRREQKLNVAAQLHDLASIHVRSHLSGPEKGRRGKKKTLTISAPLLVISHEITQSELLSDEQTPVAWYVRPGDWAAELAALPEQYAICMQSILRLHPHHDRHAKRIGRHLGWQFRVRANERSWAQPNRVRAMLTNAGVEIDRKNAGRFRRRIEEALDHLTRIDPPVIGGWRYAAPVETAGRGWFDRWLDAGLVITPPAAITEGYAKIGGRRRRGPRKLPDKT